MWEILSLTNMCRHCHPSVWGGRSGCSSWCAWELKSTPQKGIEAVDIEGDWDALLITWPCVCPQDTVYNRRYNYQIMSLSNWTLHLQSKGWQVLWSPGGREAWTFPVTSGQGFSGDTGRSVLTFSSLGIHSPSEFECLDSIQAELIKFDHFLFTFSIP